jgi:hypothetical protein
MDQSDKHRLELNHCTFLLNEINFRVTLMREPLQDILGEKMQSCCQEEIKESEEEISLENIDDVSTKATGANISLAIGTNYQVWKGEPARPKEE